MVIGSSGAGKSRLAREMAEILDLRVVHLDRHFWKPGWVEPDKNEWAQTVVELASDDEWVMDGNYGRSMHLRLPRAEATVLLDLPVWQCILGIYGRSTLYRRQARPDLAEGCAEKLPDWKFISYVLKYKWGSRQRALRRIAAEPHVRLYHLKSRRQTRRFLEGLRERPAKQV